MRLRLLARCLPLALVVLTLAACAHPPPAGRIEGAQTLRIGMTTEPNSLSPLLALNDYEQLVDRLIFDVLVTVDPNGRLRPRLAAVVPTLENGGIARDGLTITYRLRRGVRWQDGVPFTSADVKFSYAALMNRQNNVPNRHGYDQIASVETSDDQTVVFRMKRRYAPAITSLFSDAAPNPILPAHLLMRYRDLNRIPFNERPVGTGPYKVIRWSRGQEIELAANADYYGGKPKIPKIIVRFIPDEATILNQLRTHDLDVFAEASNRAFAQIKSIPGVAYSFGNIHGAANLLINNRRPLLRDVRVRKAIAYAIDKRAIVDNFTYGSATVATEDLPAFMWAYDPQVLRYEYDPPRARRLLRKAGWVRGADGIVHKDGRPLTLDFAFAQNNESARLVSIQLQAYLHAVGIDAELKGYTGSVMFGAYSAGGIYQTGNFDLAFYTMTLGIDPDSSGRFTCGAIPPNGQNYSRYCDTAMDAAQQAGLETFDRSRRKAAYARSQALLARDVPIVFIDWPKDIEAYDARLHDIRPNPVTLTWNAQNWTF